MTTFTGSTVPPKEILQTHFAIPADYVGIAIVFFGLGMFVAYKLMRNSFLIAPRYPM